MAALTYSDMQSRKDESSVKESLGSPICSRIAPFLRVSVEPLPWQDGVNCQAFGDLVRPKQSTGRELAVGACLELFVCNTKWHQINKCVEHTHPQLNF